MPYDYVDSIPFSGKASEEMLKKDSKSNANSLLISKAQNLGINVSRYYTYDESGKVDSIDTASLNAEIAKVTQEKKALERSEADSFSQYVSAGGTMNIEEAKVKVNKLKESVDNEYKKALVQYADSFKGKTDLNAEEIRLENKWEEIKTKSVKFIGVDASNVTVLEGAKEFINSIYKVVNDTKTKVDKKQEKEESVLAIDSKEEISFKDNKLETYGIFAEDDTNPFAGAYLKSAVETFDIEEEKDDAVA